MRQSSSLISFREGTRTHPALGGKCSQIFTAAPALNDLKTVWHQAESLKTKWWCNILGAHRYIPARHIMQCNPAQPEPQLQSCHHLSTTQLGVCKPACLGAWSTSRNISTPLPLPFSLRYPGGKQHQVVKRRSEDRTRGCPSVPPWQICQMSSFKWGFCQEEADECCKAAMARQPCHWATGMLPRCLSWPPCLNIHQQGNGACLNATAESVLFLLRNCFHHSLYKR